jgi:phospholipid-binding lipoprotein MlaA
MRRAIFFSVFLAAALALTGLFRPASVLAAEAAGGDVDDEFEDFLADDFPGEGQSGGGAVEVADPLYYWNLAMFHVNDKVYFWALKPVSRGYRAVVPELARVGVKNFFTNLGAPIRTVNCLLQGKSESAGAEIARFMVNTVVGGLGFVDVASRYPELALADEDFGQTLGLYGIGDGIYIVWPLLGPSTLRDTVGDLGDRFIDPLSYVEPVEASIGVTSLDTVNSTSFRIGDYEALKDAALVPYDALRDAYLQNRRRKIQD